MSDYGLIIVQINFLLPIQAKYRILSTKVQELHDCNRNLRPLIRFDTLDAAIPRESYQFFSSLSLLSRYLNHNVINVFKYKIG